MRRLAALILAGGMLWPAAAHAWTPHIAAAQKWASTRQGSITFAVRTDEHLCGRGLDRQVPSASVFKAMVLVAYLRQRNVPHRDLRASDKALLDPMIRRSDNVA